MERAHAGLREPDALERILSGADIIQEGDVDAKMTDLDSNLRCRRPVSPSSAALRDLSPHPRPHSSSTSSKYRHRAPFPVIVPLPPSSNLIPNHDLHPISEISLYNSQLQAS
ncbi:hypothetical protein BT96DRAFT_570029 [Gymnopus androsaceus JB14]|uniref:Uncharacterized protein n=1 Tax=Gymnopus androsaceus JB14 TaxID=1447944 RepID=A0A6A4HZ58_9AGAR|nr:hypothetical protein BT96DRAFT_570029 [Gymnopus androsaceus JB14]